MAWAAGFFDGEGYIGIQRRTDRPGGRLVIVTVQKHVEPLLKMQRIFGGGHLHRTKEYGGRSNARWELTWSNKRAAEILTHMRPYLAAKAEEADIAIEFQSSVRQGALTTSDVVEAARTALSARKHREVVMPSVPV